MLEEKIHIVLEEMLLGTITKN